MRHMHALHIHYTLLRRSEYEPMRSVNSPEKSEWGNRIIKRAIRTDGSGCEIRV